MYSRGLISSSFLAILIAICLLDEAAAGPKFRIVSGRIAKVSEFPYQISMEQNFRHWCGGSIINEHVVVSAAHCVIGIATLSPVPEDKLRVRVGADVAETGGVVHNVAQIKQHERFGEDPTVDEHDICVIKLAQPITYGMGVSPIALTSVEPEEGAKAWITGYGHTEIMRRSSGGKPLSAIQVPIVDRQQCAQIHSGFGNKVTDLMICAGLPQGHKDACKGDSGGPIVVDDELVGVVAWGQGCGHEGVPGVYTSIAKYRSWLDSAISAMQGMWGKRRHG